MKTIKVKNVSTRPYANVGGEFIAPGETKEVKATAAVDIEGNNDLEIVEAEETETEEAEDEKKAGWTAPTTTKKK